MVRKVHSPFERMEYTRIYLWRHPVVRGALDGQVFGHYDAALTREGKDQGDIIARRMSRQKLAAVYCSDLQRSMLVAEAVARSQSPRRKPKVTKDLRELNLGAWEAMTFEEIRKKYPKELEARYKDLANFAIDGGESLEQLAARVIPVFQEMIAKHKGKQICVIAHGGVNRVFLTKLMGAPLERVFRIDQQYACLNVIDVYPDGVPLIKRLNEPLSLE
ncbi:MAG: histidine phosphatase family protein [Thermodesulfobacteriota bacterium]